MPRALETRGRWLTLALNGVYKDFEMNFFGQIARDLGTGTGNSAALDPRGHYESNHAQLDLIHKANLASDIEIENKLSLAYMAQRSRLYLFPAGALLPIGKDGNAFSTPNVGKVLFTDGYISSPCPTEYNAGVESTLLVSKFKNHLLRASGGFKYIDAKFEAYKNFGPGVIDGSKSPIDGTLTDVTGTPYVYIPNKTRKVLFLSLQDEFSLAPRWTLTTGIRNDYYSEFGSTINPRVALVWNKEAHLSVKFLYGRAFRAPSFQELYMQNNPSGIGNIDVKPETIDMREIGVEYRPNNKWHVGANIYDYTADKLIGTVPVVAGTTQAANVGKQLGRGIETILQYEPTEKMILSADYAYRWTKNDSTGKAVVDVPVHIGHLKVDWEFFAHGVLAWETQIVANTTRAPNDSRQKIGDYAVSHLSVGYDPTHQTNIKLSVRNIFDKEYYYPMTTANISDIPAPGRSVYAQISYRF